MYPHRIRLRGPWTLKTDKTATSVNVSDRSSAQLDPTASAIQLCRRFSWPQPLQAHERLWLVLEQSVVTGATLNDTALELAAVGEAHEECEVTSLTRRSNHLALKVAAAEFPRPFPKVALEVRCRSFLRQTKWHIDTANRTLQVAGLLVGMNPAPLELYVRLGDANVLYTPVHADRPCSPFSYRSEIPAAALDGTVPIQIDLVSGGVIWHRVTGQLGDQLPGR